MLEFDRRYRLAIIGTAIAALFGLSGLKNYQWHPSYTDDAAAHDYEISKPSSSPVIMPGSEEYPPRANPRPDREEYRAEEDLYAQRRMAGWTIVIAILSFFMTFITGGGVYLIGRTLAATQRVQPQIYVPLDCKVSGTGGRMPRA